MIRPQVHVVSGPSSCGKSCYIKETHKPSEEILFPRMLDSTQLNAKRSYIFHYNLFRPYSAAHKFNKLTHLLKDPITYFNITKCIKNGQPFDCDRSLKQLLDFSANTAVTILVVSRPTLLYRISHRNGPEILRPEKDSRYQNDKFMEIAESIDLCQLYERWVFFLERRNLPYKFIESEDGEYTEIPSKQEMLAYVTGK